MRIRVPLLFIGLICLAASVPAKAQYGFEKWEVAPFVGIETSGSVPVTNSLTVDRLRVDSGTSLGTFVDYRLTENAQAELMWNRNMTSFSERDAATGIYSKLFNSDIDQFHFGFLYMLRNGEKKLRPFIAGGIGFTHDSNGGNNSDKTSFSYGLGGGVKYYLTPHIACAGMCGGCLPTATKHQELSAIPSVSVRKSEYRTIWSAGTLRAD